MSLTLKFALFTSLLCMAIIGGTTFLSYRISYLQLESSLGQELEAIVRTAAIEIDGSIHDRIQGKEDANSEAFLSIREYLRAVKDANGLNSPVYTFRREGESLKFVVMTNEKPFIGDSYSIRREMLPTLNDGKPAYTGVYQDAHGQWISAYAPILDANGHPSGLLEADYRVEEFLAIQRQTFLLLLVKALVFSLLAVILSFLLAKTVTRKINHLTRVTEKISLGKIDTPIQIGGGDEVARLADSLERMRESLKIAAEMIQ